MTLKQKVHLHFTALLNDKITLLQQALADLKESGANETKRTAGDKHETALAMLQAEQARKQAQLHELQQQKAVLVKINPLLTPAAIVNGSLVKTNNGYLYLSVPLGRAVVEGVTVTALSQHSPLGSKLLHLKKGQTATVNSVHYIVEHID